MRTYRLASVIIVAEISRVLEYRSFPRKTTESSSKYQERYESDQIQTGASSGAQPAGEAEDAEDGDSDGDNSEN